MSAEQLQALQNAAFSSAMEGLALNQEQLALVQALLDGRLSLRDYLSSVRAAYGETK